MADASAASGISSSTSIRSSLQKKWNTLRVVVRGDHFQVVYNSQPVIDIDDHTFMAGRGSLWTKSDAITYFDDLQLRILK